MRSKHTVINAVVSFIVNVGINVGIGYGALKGCDHAGLWKTPKSPDASETPMATDMILTCFVIVFLTSLLVKGGTRKAVQEGKLGPVDPSPLTSGVWRILPVRTENNWRRAFYFGLAALIFLALPSLVALSVGCAAGWMNEGADDPDPVCHMGATSYIWFKGLWAGLVAAIAFPFLTVGAANRNHIPEHVYGLFLEETRYVHSDNERHPDHPAATSDQV